MKILIAACSLFVSTHAFGSEILTKQIRTPRGDSVEVTVHSASAQPGPTIVVAPGQSCNSRGELFETLGAKGSLSRLTIVRFEWAYCLKDAKSPSPQLKNEIEDFAAVLSFAKTLPSVDASRVVIAGKSLGSIVAYSIFRANREAKALVLLTPVCTYTRDDDGKSLPKTQVVCDEHYPQMKADARPVLMALGERDDLCLLDVLYDYLKDSKRNVAVSVFGGDHGFRIAKADKTIDGARTTRNIEAVVGTVSNWVDLKLNP